MCGPQPLEDLQGEDMPRGLPLKVWSSDQKPQHHLGTCYRCTLSVSTPDLLNQLLHFTRSLGDSGAHKNPDIIDFGGVAVRIGIFLP